MSTRTLTFVLAIGLLPSLVPAQGQVHVVDAAGGAGAAFTDLPAAVAAAAPGDTVLVRSGAYSPFTLDGKGLFVLADTGADVAIDGTVAVRNLPAGQSVMLRGLATGAVLHEGLLVEDCAGGVRVEDCSFTGQAGTAPSPFFPQQTLHYDGWAGARLENSGDVAFARCELIGGEGLQAHVGGGSGDGAHGLDMSGSVAVFEDGTCFGGRGGVGSLYLGIGGYPYPYPGSGGVGASVHMSTLVVGGSALTGGPGAHGESGDFECSGGASGGSGATVWADSTFYPRDSTFTGGPAGLGGNDGVGGSCSDGSDGQPITTSFNSTTIPLSGGSRELVAPAPFRVPGVESLQFAGTPGDLVLSAFAAPSGGQVILPPLGGTLFPVDPLLVTVHGAIPAGGVLDVPVSVLALPAGLASVALHGQAAHVDAAGQPVLGPFSSVLLLGPGY